MSKRGQARRGGRKKEPDVFRIRHDYVYRLMCEIAEDLGKDELFGVKVDPMCPWNGNMPEGASHLVAAEVRRRDPWLYLRIVGNASFQYRPGAREAVESFGPASREDGGG